MTGEGSVFGGWRHRGEGASVEDPAVPLDRTAVAVMGVHRNRRDTASADRDAAAEHFMGEL